MVTNQHIALLIPARNEADSLPHVLASRPGIVDRLIVIDNGSSDGTARVARQFGAEVVHEPHPGYGRACLAGMARLKRHPPDIVAFADADGSDDLSRFDQFIEPLLSDRVDFILASRIPTEPGALSPQQRFGNWLAARLIRIVWGRRYRDLGPMRAIRWKCLLELQMRDPDYGWTVEMQIRALRCNCRIQEVAMPYHLRVAGRSQISGTLKGVLCAGTKILWVIGREALATLNPFTLR
jgi:glycosyltransferase involved in cell wall biosynthesis